MRLVTIRTSENNNIPKGECRMKNMLAKIKDSKGFVSLEVIAIAVIIIALAAFVMIKFKGTAGNASKSADSQIEGIMDNVAEDAGDDLTAGN